MSNRLTHEEFLKRLPTVILNKFIIKNSYVTADEYIILEDSLGILYKSKPHWLMSGRIPSIITAIDKTDAINKITLNIFKGTLKVVSKYIGDASIIHVEDKYGVIFKTTPANLKDGKYPTLSSALDKNAAFISHAIAVHGKKYDYSNINCINTENKVNIICKKHGEFLQSYQNHVNCRQGCRKCFIEKNTENRRFTTEEFIKKAEIVHKKFYDYSTLTYINSSSKINVICPIHGEYTTNANNHLRGSKCPKCSRNNMTHLGYNRTQWIKKFNEAVGNKQCLVYIVLLYNNEESFIKIGRTFRDIKYRLNHAIPYNYKILKLISGDSEYIYNLEKKLHKKYKQYKYEPLINFKGHSECFNLNILTDINKNKNE